MFEELRKQKKITIKNQLHLVENQDSCLYNELVDMFLILNNAESFFIFDKLWCYGGYCIELIQENVILITWNSLMK